MEPQTRYCTSADGTRIAHVTAGTGPALLLVSSWAHDAETYRAHPEGPGFVEGLTRNRRLVMFDRRGVGASQRDPQDLSLEAQVADIAAVVDDLGLDHFDMFGFGDGTLLMAPYAASHPDRVRRLVLWAAYAFGAGVSEPEAARSLAELMRRNWSLGRRAFADIVYPTGPTDLQRSFSNFLRGSVSPETAARCFEFSTSADVRRYLADITAPTLLLHRRGDRMVPMAAGRAVASAIPGARLVALDGDVCDLYHNHGQYLHLVTEFFDEGAEGATVTGAAQAGGLATILFTDMESSTALTQRLGDAKAQELVRSHNTIVRDALKTHGGSEIKHTGDGIMASFPSASGALECAMAIQRALEAQAAGAHSHAPLRVRIGLNAGEPVVEEDDLFGASVQLARRVCDQAKPGQIVVADVVRQLATGKGFLFSDLGDVVPKGFEEPVRLYEVRWREGE